MSQADYVHGYSGDEEERLLAQAKSLTELLHWDTRYPPGVGSCLRCGNRVPRN
ncbi:MAG: hypothetical protein HY328_13035, partial [Chloroflexi bacterium]|nr:hypothetical protein [Chloroflexota bacterium]